MLNIHIGNVQVPLKTRRINIVRVLSVASITSIDARTNNNIRIYLCLSMKYKINTLVREGGCRNELVKRPLNRWNVLRK